MIRPAGERRNDELRSGLSGARRGSMAYLDSLNKLRSLDREFTHAIVIERGHGRRNFTRHFDGGFVEDEVADVDRTANVPVSTVVAGEVRIPAGANLPLNALIDERGVKMLNPDGTVKNAFWAGAGGIVRQRGSVGGRIGFEVDR